MLSSCGGKIEWRAGVFGMSGKNANLPTDENAYLYFYFNKKLLLNIYNLFTTSHIWIWSTMILIQIMFCFRSQLIELK